MDMVWGAVLRILLGVVVGFCIGMTGVGGGVLVLPALTLILKLSPSVSVGTASLYAFLTKCSAVFHHHRLQTINYKISGLFLLGAVPGNIAASLWVTQLVERLQERPEQLAEFQSGLKLFMAGVVLFCGVMVTFNLFKKTGAESEEHGNLLYRYLQARPVLKAISAAAGGLVIGILIGLTSIGGGVLIIPLLILVFGLSTSRTIGTSILVAVVLTLITSLVYGAGGQMDFYTALLMTAGSLVGVYFGSKACKALPERSLKAIVTVVVLVSGVLMLVNGGGH